MTTTSDRSRMLKLKQRKPVALSQNARLVLERRYLAKDDAGEPIESPEQMFARVAYSVAQAELLYKPLRDPLDVALWEERLLRPARGRLHRRHLREHQTHRPHP